jgi:hypothetical protein
MAMLLMLMAVEPLFDRVIAFGAPLLPTATEAQLKLVGESVCATALIPPRAHRPIASARTPVLSGKGHVKARRTVVKAVVAKVGIKAGISAV